jgi:hypothetical protein
MDVELRHVGVDLRDVHLPLRLDAVFLGHASTGALIGKRDVDPHVHMPRSLAAGHSTVGGPGFAAGTLGIRLRLPLGERSRLPLLSTERLVQLARKFLNALLGPFQTGFQIRNLAVPLATAGTLRGR